MPMIRFVFFALLVLVLLQGLYTFALDLLDLYSGPSLSGPQETLPTLHVLGAWLLEALGLTALFLILRGRTASPYLDGLLASWGAWIFRGPLLVLTVVAVTGRISHPWWSMALSWLAFYTLAGLILALLAGRVGLKAEA